MAGSRTAQVVTWLQRPGWLLAFGGVLLLAFADGGFFPSTWWPATAAFASVAALAFLIRGSVALTRGQTLVVGALIALVGWTALSALWSPVDGASLPEARRTLVYAALALAAAAVRGHLLDGTLAAIAVVSAYAVGQRLAGGPPSPPDPFEGTLLQEPIGYANGLGALAAIGLTVTIVRTMSGRRLRYGALAVLFAVTLTLTGSRGGWLAAVVGVGVGVALVLRRRRIAQVLTVLAATMLAVVLSLSAGPAAADLAERAGDRPLYWHVAWEQVAEAPLVGGGAGTFELAWLERRPVAVEVQDAHTLYLELLAELGVVGLGLLGLALLPPLLAGLRGADAAATGGYLGFLVHAGIDWDWELPAVTVAGLLCGIALLAHERASFVAQPHLGLYERKKGAQ